MAATATVHSQHSMQCDAARAVACLHCSNVEGSFWFNHTRCRLSRFACVWWKVVCVEKQSTTSLPRMHLSLVCIAWRICPFIVQPHPKIEPDMTCMHDIPKLISLHTYRDASVDVCGMSQVNSAHRHTSSDLIRGSLVSQARMNFLSLRKKKKRK